MSVSLAGLELAHPVLNGSGTLDALSAFDGPGRRDAGLRGPRHEDHHAGAAAGQPAAADRGGAGGARQLDRPARARRDGVPGLRAAATGGARRRAADRVGRRVRRGRLRARRRGAGRRGRGRGVRAQPLVPERRERVRVDRLRPPRDRGRRVRLPDADGQAAAGEARADHEPAARRGPRGRGGGRRRAGRGQHGARHGRRARPGALAAGRRRRWPVRARPSARSRCARCSSAARRSRSTSSALGGVETARDALDLLDAGACAVGVGTAIFRDPRTPARVRDGLAELAAVPAVRSLAPAAHLRGVGARVPEGAVTLYWSLISIIAKGRLSG